MRHPRQWQWSAAVAVAAVVLSACGGSSIPNPQGIQKRVALSSFSGPNACADLEQYIEDTAVLQMRSEMEAQKQGAPMWGWWGGWRGGEGDMLANAGGTAPTSKGPTNYTQTNTQVAGVDEADFVKNDGTRIFVLSGDTLYLSNSWPADTLAIAAKLKIEGYPREMFLDEKNHLVVFSSLWQSYPLDPASRCMDTGAFLCSYGYSNSTKVTVLDVSDLAHPAVTRQYFLPGNYTNSRRIGSSVRVVLNDSFRYPDGVKYWPDYEPGLYDDKSKLGKKLDQMMNENESLIRDQSLDKWLPSGRVVTDSGTVNLDYDCTQFAKSNAPTRLGLFTVATLNLDNAGSMHRTSVVGEAGEIYSSAKNLYVATQHWWWWPQIGQEDTTYLHKFDISQPDDAIYVASGSARGYILDQFSMDEDDNGFFRIATTIGRRVKSNPVDSWGTIETTNLLQVMGENAGALEVVGQSDELAKGERLYSSRFVGKKGFIVTFKQVDPLFTFDLSNPTSPKQMGELQIPGFSSYIHPIDDDHLLTIGTYVDPDNQWRDRRLQLSMFDVSDLANPKQTSTITVGNLYGYSEAQWEHKAFNYFAAKKLLAIPFFDYTYSNGGGWYWEYFTSDLRLFSIDPAQGITPRGALSMNDLYVTMNYSNWIWYYTPTVRRSVMADDFVYAISDAGIRVANLSSLSKPIATVMFDKPDYR